MALDFDASPLGPEIESGGVLDDVGDEGSADAGGDLEEVVAAVGRADVFSMGDAAHQAHGGDELRIDGGQLTGVSRSTVDDVSGEDSALVHHLHRGLAVLADGGEDDLAVGSDGVDVEDVAGDESLEEVIALAVAEFVERAP